VDGIPLFHHGGADGRDRVIVDAEVGQLQVGDRAFRIGSPERQRSHFEIRQQTFDQAAVEIGHRRPAQVEFPARTQWAHVIEPDDDLLAVVFAKPVSRLIQSSIFDAAESAANLQLRGGSERVGIVLLA
jgi:hypothetical protein